MDTNEKLTLEHKTLIDRLAELTEHQFEMLIWSILDHEGFKTALAAADPAPEAALSSGRAASLRVP